MDPAAGGQHEGHQEEEGEEGEGEDRLVAQQGRAEAHQARGHHLQQPRQRGQATQQHQQEEEAGPQPARGQRGQRGLHQGDARQPQPGPRDGGRVAAIAGGQLLQVDGLEVVCDAEEGEDEERGQHDPDEVGGEDDAGVPHQVVVVAVVGGVGRHRAQPQLQAVHHLGRRRAGLGHVADDGHGHGALTLARPGPSCCWN